MKTTEGGFTLVEMLVATALTLAITGAALALARPAQGAFQVQMEDIDITQRLRAAAAALSRDISMAGSGLPVGTPAVSSYLSPAGESGITVRFMAGAGQPVTESSYYVSQDPDSDTTELRRWNGTSHLPVIDEVERVVFTCMAVAAVVDCGDPAITRVRVALRVRAARPHMRSERSTLKVLPQELVVDIALRRLPGD